jgi:hypothetical protein
MMSRCPSCSQGQSEVYFGSKSKLWVGDMESDSVRLNPVASQIRLGSLLIMVNC